MNTSLQANKEALNLSDSAVRDLNALGIESIQDLTNISRVYIKKHFSWPVDELILLARETAFKISPRDEGTSRQGQKIVPEVQPDDPDAIPIEMLGLSNRSYYGLKRNGCHYVSQILSLKKEDLMKMKTIGSLAADEILCAIQTFSEQKEDISESMKPKLKSREESIAVSEAFMEIPISEMDLSVRAYNGLRRHGIDSIGQLADMTERDLEKLRNLGKKTIIEILEKRDQFDAQLYSNTVSSSKASRNNGVEELSSSLKQRWGHTILYWVSVINNLPKTVDRNDQNAILQSIHSDPQIFDAQEELARNYAEEHIDGCDVAEMKAYLSEYLIPESCITEILSRLEKKGNIRQDGERILRTYPSVMEYAAGLKNEKQRQFLLQKLEGKTLEEIGSANGITRERVRQIIAKTIENRPKLAEDRYLPLYEQYECTLEDFCLAFGEQPYAYYYQELAADRSKNRKPLTDAAEDETLPAVLRRGAEKAAYRNYLHLDGVRVKKTRPDLVHYYIRRYCKEKTGYAEFEAGYHSFLEQQGLGDDPSLTLNSRTYESRFAEDNRSVLWSRGKQLRYYEIDEIDRDAFLEALHLDRFHNVSISTLLLLRDYPDLMQEYDVRDEYELHNLLKKLIGNQEGEIDFSRMPIINFGKADRGAQVLEILLLYAPISPEDLADQYEKAYGFQAASALSNDFKAIGEYFHNGMYTIDSPALPPEHFERLKQDLTEDYYLITDICDHYVNTVVGADLKYISPYTLRTLGFHVYDGYVVSNRFSSAIDYFRMLLRKDDVVDLSAFPKSILDNGTFSGLRYDQEREHELMECSPTLLLSIRELEAAGYTKADIQSYCDAVARRVQPGTFVTVASLRNSGFTHPLDNLGFDDWFYASLIWLDPRFRSLRIGGTRLSILGNRRPVFVDLLQDILKRHGNRMDIYELRSYLEEQYGIVLDKDKLAFLIRKSNMYYDGIMKVAYTDYDTYYEEI